MSKNDGLFLLIKSLSRREKSYFKKFIVGSDDKSDKKYLLLFDAIDKQKVYSEDSIRKKFKNEQFIKQYAVAKNYLTQVLLKSLKLQNSEESTNSILFNLITEADILFSRALYKDAEKKLDKALELAEKTEKFPMILEICDRYSRLMAIRASFIPEKTDFLLNKQLEVVGKVKQLAEVRNLLHIYRQISYSEQSFSSKENQMTELMKRNYFSNETMLNSFRSQTAMLNLRAMISQMFFHDHKTSLKINKKVVDLFHSHPILAKEDQMTHVAILSNYILDSIATGNEEEYLKYIKILRASDIDKREDELRVFERTVMLKLVYFIKFLKFEEGEKYCNDLEVDLEERANNINPDFFVSIVDSINIIYYHAKNFSKAIKGINKILLNKYEVRWDVQSFSHLLYLVIQFEKKDYDHLEYHLKQAEKFIKQKSGVDGYESVLLKFFWKVVKTPNKITISESLNELKAALKNHVDNPNVQLVYDFFNFDTWVEAQLKGVEMKSLLKPAKRLD